MSVSSWNGTSHVTQDAESSQSRSSGVTITDYPTITSPNPKPIIAAMIEDYISADKLKELSGKEDLIDVISLSLQVDTVEASLGNLGALLVNLKELCLINSCVASIRDLGSALTSLTVLRMTRSGLDDVDGISMIPTLEELYVAYNNITDLSPLSFLDNLKVLDLEGNNIDDIAQVEFLSLCFNLEALSLEGNSVQRAPQPGMKVKDLKFYNYKQAIISILPNLVLLDGDATSLSLDEDDLFDSVNDAMTQDGYSDVSDSLKNNAQKYQINENEKINSGGPVMVLSRPRPMTAQPRLSLEKDTSLSPWLTDEITSHLTHGSEDIYCGSAGRSLRRRVKKKNISVEEIESNNKEITNQSKERELQTIQDDETDSERDILFEELRQWRQQFERKSKPTQCHDDHRVPTPPQTSKPNRPQTAGAILGRRSPNRKIFTGS